MRRFVVLVLAFTLAGCATGPSLQSRMAAYIGSSESTLVQSLGVPDKQITVNGVTYLGYVRRQAQVEADGPGWVGLGPPGPYLWPYGGGPYYGFGRPSTVTMWSCNITFMLKEGRVYTVALRGNYCD
jgi:hypothetical protein